MRDPSSTEMRDSADRKIVLTLTTPVCLGCGLFLRLNPSTCECRLTSPWYLFEMLKAKTEALHNRQNHGVLRYFLSPSLPLCISLSHMLIRSCKLTDHTTTLPHCHYHATTLPLYHAYSATKPNTCAPPSPVCGCGSWNTTARSSTLSWRRPLSSPSSPWRLE